MVVPTALDGVEVAMVSTDRRTGAASMFIRR